MNSGGRAPSQNPAARRCSASDMTRPLPMRPAVAPTWPIMPCRLSATAVTRRVAPFRHVRPFRPVRDGKPSIVAVNSSPSRASRILPKRVSAATTGIAASALGYSVSVGDQAGLQDEPRCARQQCDQAADPSKPSEQVVQGFQAHGGGRAVSTPGSRPSPAATGSPPDAGRAATRQASHKALIQGFMVKVKWPCVLWVSTDVTCHSTV